MNELEKIIRCEIAANGAITFARFMELALYHPEHGYYERDGDLIGRRGDYFTSVSVGRLFGELLACWFADRLGECEMGNAECGTAESRPAARRPLQLVEAGAHDGRLAADILGWIQANRPGIFARLEYGIVEPSLQRRGWQEEALRQYGDQVRWSSALPGPAAAPHSALRTPHFPSIRGVIFANELLDALPVHRLGWDARARRWFEWGVVVEGDRFAWRQLPEISAPARRQPLAGLPGGDRLEDLPPELLEVLPDGYTVEVCPQAVEWWHTAARALECGWLVTFDYGVTAAEFFRPGRTEGTARAYYAHRLSAHLLARPGRQDLTAHVNFAALQAAGETVGLKTEGLFPQGQFLARIVKRVAEESGASFSEWTPERTRQLQTLIHPDHLGRAFRVLVQRRRTARVPAGV